MNQITTIQASEIRVGDTLCMSHGFVGKVVALPEWEAIETFGETKNVGTITCEGFGAFVNSDDEMRVSR